MSNHFYIANMPMENRFDRQIEEFRLLYALQGGHFMELGQKIKEYRNALQMTQEELAERMFVSRQTISNWENDKSYPDIQSLLLLSNLFNVSLDTLVKGDVERMKEKIDETTIKNFNRDSIIFSILLIVIVATPMLLLKWVGFIGLAIWAILAGITFYFALSVERVKKQHDIYTYKEIVAFMSGEKLDGIEKAREEGKRKYQKAILCLAIGMAALIITMIISNVLFKG